MRSSKPPWPGISWLESLAPKRRFTALSTRSPNWQASASTMLTSASFRPSVPRAPGEGKADKGRRERADDKPAPGLFGRDAGGELGPADQAPRRISGRVGGPGNGKKIEHGGGAEGRVAAKPDQGRGRQRRIGQPGERPEGDCRAEAVTADERRAAAASTTSARSGAAERDENGDGANAERLRSAAVPSKPLPRVSRPHSHATISRPDHDQDQKRPGLIDRGGQRQRGKHDGRGDADREFGLSARFAFAAVVGKRSSPRHAVDLAEVPPKRRLRR